MSLSEKFYKFAAGATYSGVQPFPGGMAVMTMVWRRGLNIPGSILAPPIKCTVIWFHSLQTISCCCPESVLHGYLSIAHTSNLSSEILVRAFSWLSLLPVSHHWTQLDIWLILYFLNVSSSPGWLKVSFSWSFMGLAFMTLNNLDMQ